VMSVLGKVTAEDRGRGGSPKSPLPGKRCRDKAKRPHSGQGGNPAFSTGYRFPGLRSSAVTTFYETIMKGLYGNDSVKIFPTRGTLTPMPRIPEGSGACSSIIGNAFHSLPYRTSYKVNKYFNILLSFS